MNTLLVKYVVCFSFLWPMKNVCFRIYVTYEMLCVSMYIWHMKNTVFQCIYDLLNMLFKVGVGMQGLNLSGRKEGLSIPEVSLCLKL